jgi:hypothetical protein
MQNELNTQKIKELLTASTTRLSSETLDKLRMARTRALDHQRVKHSVPVLAWLGGHVTHHNETSHHSRALNWAVAAVFVACLITGISIWNNSTIEHEICDVDLAILTDDIPVHAYVD